MCNCGASKHTFLVAAINVAVAVGLLSSPGGEALCPEQTVSGSTYRLVVPESATDTILVVMADAPSTFTVTIPPACCPVPPCATMYTASPGSPAVIASPPFCAIHWVAGVDDKAFLIDTAPGISNPLHVVMKVPSVAGSSDEAYLGISAERTGVMYRPFCYPGAVTSPGALFAAVAVEDNTEILYYDCTGGGPFISGVLNIGQSFKFRCSTVSEDCSGYRVMSVGAKKFGLVSGSRESYVPVYGGSSDVLQEMMVPFPGDGHQIFSDEYLAAEFNKSVDPAIPGDVYRIMAMSNGVQVDIAANGLIFPEVSAGHPCPAVPFTLLTAGDYCDMNIDRGARISTTYGEIRVMQFMKSFPLTATGDPSSMLLVPTYRFPCEHRFFSFEGYDFDPVYLNGSYVNIVAPTSAIASTLLDNVPLPASCNGFAPEVLPGSGYAWVQCLLPDPLPPGEEHTVEGRDAVGNRVGVAVYVYGQKHGASYAYPAGMGMP